MLKPQKAAGELATYALVPVGRFFLVRFCCLRYQVFSSCLTNQAVYHDATP